MRPKLLGKLLLLTLSTFSLSVPAIADDYEFINPDLLENNPHAYCTPIVEQTIVNGIPVTRIVGHNCQSYVGGAFQLESVREQEKTKRKQIEVTGKLNLLQYFVPRSF